MSTHSSQKRKRGRDRERSPYKPRFTDEQIDAIPLIAWKQHEQESKIQQSLFWDCWKQQMSAKHRRIIFQMLTIYKDKKEKFWFDNVKRALHSFKPPRHPMSEWTEYCKLFKQHADTSAYAETASTLILPVLMQSNTASLKTLYASFKCAVEQLSQVKCLLYCLFVAKTWKWKWLRCGNRNCLWFVQIIQAFQNWFVQNYELGLFRFNVCNICAHKILNDSIHRLTICAQIWMVFCFRMRWEVVKSMVSSGKIQTVIDGKFRDLGTTSFDANEWCNAEKV